MISGVFSIPLNASSAIADGSAAPPLANHSERLRFIAGPENSLVRIVAESLSGDSSRYRPIVIYGGTGVGKSALLHALVSLRGNSNDAIATLLVTTGADFARAYANAVDTDAVEDLRARYDRCSVVIIDDLHRLSAKPAAQQFLLHMLDRLDGRDGLLVATLRNAPHDTRGLLPGLVSRLSAGLLVPLVAPQAGARRAIVEQIAAERNIELPQALVDRLANPPAALRTAFTTAPQLRAALLQLVSRANILKRTLDADLFDEFAAEHAPETKALMRQITAAVAKHFQIPVADLRGKSRKQALVHARGVAMHLCRQLTAASFATIGRSFGRRDHTTVMHSCRRIETLIETDAASAHMVAELMAQFGSGSAPCTGEA